MLLGVDCCLADCSLALCAEDGTLIDKRIRHLERGHAEEVVPLLKDLLATQKAPRIEGIAVGVGPGSFTGIRIGLAVAKALALAWRADLVGILTLDAFAAQIFSKHTTNDVTVAIDARRSQVYCRRYKKNSEGFSPTSKPMVMPYDQASALACGCDIIAGSGARYISGTFDQVEVSSAIVQMVGLSLDPKWRKSATPFYCRESDATAYG